MKLPVRPRPARALRMAASLCIPYYHPPPSFRGRPRSKDAGKQRRAKSENESESGLKKALLVAHRGGLYVGGSPQPTQVHVLVRAQRA